MDSLEFMSRNGSLMALMLTMHLAWGSDLIMDFSFLFLVKEKDNSEYRVLKAPSFSRKRVRAVPDISENWVEEYGKFKTGEEKESGFFEEKGEGSSDMP